MKERALVSPKDALICIMELIGMMRREMHIPIVVKHCV